MLDQAILDRLGPWITRFKLHGQTVGGSYEVSEDDPLLRMFIDRAPMARRVLELGCMEGGRTFPLARRAAFMMRIGGYREIQAERFAIFRTSTRIEVIRFNLFRPSGSSMILTT